jgi:hypothetical protein
VISPGASQGSVLLTVVVVLTLLLVGGVTTGLAALRQRRGRSVSRLVWALALAPLILGCLGLALLKR